MDEGEHSTCTCPAEMMLFVACLQGAKEKRLEGDEHMAVVEEFVMAVKKRHPHALIQFEDFQTDRAFAILERFRDKVLCFNGGQGCSLVAGSAACADLTSVVGALEMRHFAFTVGADARCACAQGLSWAVWGPALRMRHPAAVGFGAAV